MKFVIVESPTKARTLKRFLPREFDVEASMGHVRDLPKSKLGVDVDRDFEPEYIVSKGKGKVVQKLKDKAAKAEEIFLAMDPDREGEAIAWHVKHILQHGKAKTKKKTVSDEKFKRVTFHEITKSAIQDAIDHPGAVNTALVDAQQARRIVDRLVGYNLSPVLWRKVRRGLSAGRVQSVALRLIVEREREIEAFKPQEYWDIAAQLAGGKDKIEFVASLAEIDGKKVVVKGSEKGKGKVWIDTTEAASDIVADLEKAAYSVASVEKKERKRNPYPPYTTSTLQQAAANVLGWSGKQTMRIAQQLYEAGLITYHRTDSFNLAAEAVMQGRAYIEAQFGAHYLPQKPNYYSTKSKNAQEAHEAIRPTNVTSRTIKDSDRELTPQHEKLYQLIWRRFMACQMLPAIYDQTTINVAALGKKSSYLLRASGSVMRFDGWRVVFKGTKGDGTEETLLPEVSENDDLRFLKLLSEQKFTQPPPRFNDASLVKELEKRGIGRPSTYASIISVIIDRGYVERLEKRFQPTDIGKTVVDFLMKYFDSIMDYDFTAEMEEDLDRIARSEKNWKAVMKTFWKPFEKKVEDVGEKAKRVEIPVESTGEKCPTCKEGEVVIRSGRFGKFKSCSRFPECKYTANFAQVLEDFPCPDCGGQIVLKRTKTGRTFWGCGSYPKCNWASWQDPRPQKTAANQT